MSWQLSCLDDVAEDRIQSTLQKVMDNATNPSHKTLKSSFSSKLPSCSKEHCNTVSHSYLLQLHCTTPPYNCHNSSARRSILCLYLYICCVFIVLYTVLCALGQVLYFMYFVFLIFFKCQEEQCVVSKFSAKHDHSTAFTRFFLCYCKFYGKPV